MKVRRSLLKDSVVVRTRTGEGSYGDTNADPVTVPCQIDETRRLVRGAGGQETVSEATLILHPRSQATAGDGTITTVDPMEVFTAESSVDIQGRVSQVITAKRNRLRGYTVSVEVVCE